MVNTFTLTEEEILSKAKAIAESNIRESAYEELYDKGIYRDSVSNFDYLLAGEMDAIRNDKDPWHLYTPEGCREEAIYQLREEKSLQMAKEVGLDPSTLSWKWSNETKDGDLEYTDQENQDAEQMLKECYRGSGQIPSVDRLVDEAMAKWAEETDTGNNDPAFAGEVGEEIDQLVDNLTPFEIKTLLKDDKPIKFIEGGNCMKELKSGLLSNKYTRVFHEDDYKFNAPHHFVVVGDSLDDPGATRTLAEIYFQEGPIKECGVNGVANEDLINMVICRLEGFQKSEFACKENEQAINKLSEALMWLRKRTNDREARGVEGTHQK